MTDSLSFVQRFFLAWAWFFRTLFDGKFARNVQQLAAGEPPAQLPEKSGEAERSAPVPKAPEKPETPSVDLEAERQSAALGLLASLQREGRLVDFLKQDVAGFSDEDIGAAARVVHDGCKKALERHVTIAPVASADEGSPLTLEADYERAAYKLTGNVSGAAPHRGVLRHKGWRATQLTLPSTVAGHDSSVLAPAEVELS